MMNAVVAPPKKGDEMPDGINDIIDRLEKQKSAIENALSALRGIEHEGGGQGARSYAGARKAPATKKRGGMTPEGRRRLAEAMRRRWAVKRAAAQVKKSGGRRGAAKKATA